MKCPVCTATNLVMADRKGVEIDYCPDCRGVWLDRGELDKIIERSASYTQAVEKPAPKAQKIRSEHQVGNSTRDNRSSGKHKRPESKTSRVADLIGDLFDF